MGGFPALTAAVGWVALVSVGYALSQDRSKIRWRTVGLGLGAQWLIALLLLGVPLGRDLLATAARGVELVLEQGGKGAAFVFGNLALAEPPAGLGFVFAFRVLPTIIFVASLFAVLYHLGIMQRIVGGLASLLVAGLGISGPEALCVSASVFMGQTEAPLTIRPYLATLSRSELFTVMVAGMASVSGAILGAYVLAGGVDMRHLLSAVAMSAPASVAFAKLAVPETQDAVAPIELEDSSAPKTSNVLDAASRGASDGLLLALNVAAMLIAFIALVALADLVLSALPLVDGQPLSLARILGVLFTPVAALLGIPWDESLHAGAVLGTRTILNEIVAYQQLAQLTGLSERTQAIVTVAVCGFANLSSIGIQIGGIGGLVPERKSEIASLGVRALVAATLANFSSACITGVLIAP